jgi:hypothetical protein
MTTFDDRERAFETKFAHDAELQFRVTARRNKLFGLWAAAKLGLEGGEADAYARTVIEADFEEAGDEDVIRKVFGDLGAKGLPVSDAEVREALAIQAAEARRQIAETL